jgi:hypothetical protein
MTGVVLSVSVALVVWLFAQHRTGRLRRGARRHRVLDRQIVLFAAAAFFCIAAASASV